MPRRSSDRLRTNIALPSARVSTCRPAAVIYRDSFLIGAAKAALYHNVDFPRIQTRVRETMNSTAPVVSIIVPCRNERDHIEASLRSILVQVSPPGGVEVIIADGMSEDGTRDILK